MEKSRRELTEYKGFTQNGKLTILDYDIKKVIEENQITYKRWLKT